MPVTTIHDPSVRGFASDNYSGVHPEVLEAIVAANNFLALSVIEAARELNLRIPEDVALVCFDDFVFALYRNADRAMYEAKRNGGNQIRHLVVTDWR